MLCPRTPAILDHVGRLQTHLDTAEHDLDPSVGQDRIEHARILAVPVPDQVHGSFMRRRLASIDTSRSRISGAPRKPT
jgi:hypothetical protein